MRIVVYAIVTLTVGALGAVGGMRYAQALEDDHRLAIETGNFQIPYNPEMDPNSLLRAFHGESTIKATYRYSKEHSNNCKYNLDPKDGSVTDNLLVTVSESGTVAFVTQKSTLKGFCTSGHDYIECEAKDNYHGDWIEIGFALHPNGVVKGYFSESNPYVKGKCVTTFESRHTVRIAY